jgi:outer membrane receptor protein involved in Fe transport
MTMRASVVRRAFFVAAVGVLAGRPVGAQEADLGQLVGRVVDMETGRGLPGSQIVVEGTGMGVLAGVDGRYLVRRLAAGPVSIRVEMLGYAIKRVSGIVIPPGGTAEAIVSLEASAILLDEIVVTAAEERGSVARALDDQRNSIVVVSAITAEELSRSPDGDAGEAVRRVSGVTVQDGKYVFVRGLGERYTTTSLNGARVPSPEPERKVVPLDLFPSGLLQTITTSKTFTPDLAGDFSGAQVNIETRSFPTRREYSFSASTGFNTAATTKNIFFAPGTGSEWLGTAASDRSLPGLFTQFGNFQTVAPNQAQMNQMIRSLRNAWSARETSGRPKSSFSASVGGSDPLFGQQLGYLLSGTYSYSEDAKIQQRRAQAAADGAGGTLEINRYDGNSGGRSVLWGGLVNLSTLLGSSNRLLVNGTYSRTADDEARVEVGYDENLANTFQIQRLRYVERSVYSAQLAGEHQLGDAHRFDWSATASGVSRVEPDRSEFVKQFDPAITPAWFSSSYEGAVRTFAELDESAREGSASYTLTFGPAASQHRLKLGGLGRTVQRDASNSAYAISATSLTQADRELEPEQIFDGRFSADSDAFFQVAPLGQGGSYSAEESLVAGYAMFEWALTRNLRAVGGARVEHSDVAVDAQGTLGQPVNTDPSYTDVLPSLGVQWAASETQTVRVSASQTLSRPEYRELAPVAYRDVLGGENIVGNPDLVRSLIRNLDVRWEWYPNPGEAVTVALFAKEFENPVERIYQGTTGTAVVTFDNARSARNYGVELEIRGDLGFLAEALETTTAFANATVMSSEIELRNTGALTDANRPMVGQSPYVMNAGLTYAIPDLSVSATALYNVAGRRISSAGVLPLPNVYEESRHSLDLSLRFPLVAGLRAKADLENLLDSPYEQRQGTVVREFYKTGRTFSFGVSWQPGS